MQVDTGCVLAMRTIYHQKIRQVVDYIEANLSQKISLQDLAEVIHISPYHFHRIFKHIQKETPAECIRRLRLEKAAHCLFWTEKSITEITYDLGFSTPQNLSKSFKKHFGLSPTDLKKCKTVEELAAFHKDSKIGNVLHKNDNTNAMTSEYDDSFIENKELSEMNVEQFSFKKLMAVRVTGPYGTGIADAYQRLYSWVKPRGIEVLNELIICRDNPNFTPADKCRADVCLMVNDNTDVSDDILALEIPAGKMAVIRKTITEPSHFAQAWDQLVAAIIDAGLEFDGESRPCFELYNHSNPEKYEFDVSFYTPIKN